VVEKFRIKLWGVVWHVPRAVTVVFLPILHVLGLGEHSEDISLCVGALARGSTGVSLVIGGTHAAITSCWVPRRLCVVAAAWRRSRVAARGQHPHCD